MKAFITKFWKEKAKRASFKSQSLALKFNIQKK